MTSTYLVGLVDDVRHAVLPVRIELDVARELRINCDVTDSFRTAAEHALACAAHFLGKIGCADPAARVARAGMSITVCDDSFTSSVGVLDDTSFGVALAAGAALAALDVPHTAPSFIASAGIDESGALTDVSGLPRKVDAAASRGRKLLSGPTSLSAPSVLTPVREVEEALFLLLGPSGLRRVLATCETEASRLRALSEFAYVHAGYRHYPGALRPESAEDALLDLHRGPQQQRFQVWLALSRLALSAARTGDDCIDMLIAMFPDAAWAPDHEAPSPSRYAANVIELAEQYARAGVMPPGLAAEMSAGLIAAVTYALQWSILRTPNAALSQVFTHLLLHAALEPPGLEEFSRAVIVTLRDVVGLRAGNLLYGRTEEIPPMGGDDELTIHANYRPTGGVLELTSISFGAGRDIDADRNYLSPPILIAGDQRMAQLPDAEAIQDRFGRNTRFDFSSLGSKAFEGFQVAWRDGSGVWPPSIDALYCLRDLVPAMAATEIRFAADLGCGTGVLGLAALRACPEIQQLHFCDLLASARTTCGLSLKLNHGAQVIREVGGDPLDPSDVPFERPALERVLVSVGERSVRTSFHEAPAHQAISRILQELQDDGGKLLDLVLLSPPYLPEDLAAGGSWAAIHSTGLLEWAVARGGSFCKQMLLNISDIGRLPLKSALAQAKERGPVVCEEVSVAPAIVGFRNFEFLRPRVDSDGNALEDREGMIQRLLSSALPDVYDSHDSERFEAWWREAGLQEAPAGYRFFHRVRTYRIEYRE